MKKICMILAFTMVVNALSVKNDIPKNAYNHLDGLYTVIDDLMYDFPVKPYFGSLIEHESCISLTHSKCWNSKSRLYVKGKEEGIGLGQITRTWRDGKIRFDTLATLKRRYPNELQGLTWGNIRNKPKLQMLATVLLWRSNFKRFSTTIPIMTRIAFTDAAYNGGLGGVRRDIKLCALKKGCDKNKWFSNVEKTCSKSKKKLYGNRSACDINRHHVKDVLKTRSGKYILNWYDDYSDIKTVEKMILEVN